MEAPHRTIREEEEESKKNDDGGDRVGNPSSFDDTHRLVNSNSGSGGGITNKTSSENDFAAVPLHLWQAVPAHRLIPSPLVNCLSGRGEEAYPTGTCRVACFWVPLLVLCFS